MKIKNGFKYDGGNDDDDSDNDNDDDDDDDNDNDNDDDDCYKPTVNPFKLHPANISLTTVRINIENIHYQAE